MSYKKRPNSGVTVLGHISKHCADNSTTGPGTAPGTNPNGGMIPPSFIRDLLARVDVVEVVNQRVKLKRMGKNYSACCPFHDEKTPSFTVSPEKQFYYCFGCGAGGDVISFLMKLDGLEFPEAVEQLARLQGLEIPRNTNYKPKRDGLSPSKRRQFRALLEQEAYIIRFAKGAQQSGETLTPDDARRVLLADERVRKLRRALHV